MGHRRGTRHVFEPRPRVRFGSTSVVITAATTATTNLFNPLTLPPATLPTHQPTTPPSHHPAIPPTHELTNSPLHGTTTDLRQLGLVKATRYAGLRHDATDALDTYQGLVRKLYNVDCDGV